MGRRSSASIGGPSIGRRRRWFMRDLGGCSLWVHGDAGVTLNSGNVSAWTDQSGVGSSLAQATGAAQPLFVSGAVNGHGALRFDGVNHFMTSAFTLGTTTTTIIVYKSIALGGSGNNDIVFDGANLASMLFFSDSTLHSGLYAGSTLSGAVVANGAYAVVTCQFNGGSSLLRANGTQTVTGAAGSATAGGMTLGSLQNGTRKTNIEVAEVAVFNRLLSLSEYTFAEQQLRSKYGL